MKTKKCRICGCELTPDNQYITANYRQNICRPCKKEYTRQTSMEWRRKHPDSCRSTVKEAKKKVVMEVFSHYCGGDIKCQKCGFNDIRALSIDHINGDGNKHREEIGRGGGHDLCYWLRLNGYPQGFQILCMNCQFIKRHEKQEYSKSRRLL